MIPLKSEADLGRMASAGRIVAEALEVLAEVALPGATTMDLERKAEEIVRARGGVPAFKGYRGYPACICASLNSGVVHGIPSASVRLLEGDVLGLDIGVEYGGFFADAALTVGIGKVSADAERLMRVTRESLYKAIENAVVDNRLSDIGHAVQRHVEAAGYSVVRAFVGHGIGRRLHEEPQVPNFGAPGKGPRLKAGMTLAIEPMINAGGPDVKVLGDGWTAVTADGSLSAHYEHTVAVTKDGPRILTVL